MTIENTYDLGTVSVDSSGNVTGSGVIWSLVKKFDLISIDGGDLRTITEVTDSSHLKIQPWSGTASAKPYVIYYNSLLRLTNGELALRTNELVKTITGDGYFVYVGPDDTEPDPAKGKDGQYALKPSTGETWLKASGVWNSSGVYGGLYPANNLSDVANVATARSNLYAASLDALAYNGMQMNGGCDVSQENSSASVAIGSGALYKYCLDGWQIEKSGTSQFTVEQAASVFDGFQKEIKIAVTTANTSAGNSAALNHMIEGYRFAAAAWGTPAAVPVTIGFLVKSSVTGTMAVAIWNSDYSSYALSSVTISAVNTPQWVTATFTAQTSGTWNKTNGLGARLSIYLKSDWYSYNVLASVGNTFELTGLIVLPGAVAIPASITPLFLRSYGDELRACQRYYYAKRAAAVADFFGIGYAYSSAGALCSLRLPVVMRATPTVTFAGSFAFYISSTNTVSSVSANGPMTKTEAVGIQADGSGWGLTVGLSGQLLDGGSNNAAVLCDARL